MSALNRAIIKAYQRHSESPGPHASFADATPPLRGKRLVWPDACEGLLATAGEAVGALASQLADFSLLGANSVLVTGCRRGEGRTTLALTLARHWSSQGRRVLVVDADLERPGLAASLGVPTAAGIAALVSGKTALSEILLESNHGPVILPLGLSLAAHQLEQVPDRFVAQREMLLRRFDCICFDAGPLACPPGPVINWLLGGGTTVDTALVIRDTRNTNASEGDRLGRQLVRAGVARWHHVENFT
jgi:Mrp family chromosome partitioning ATPase